MSPIALLAGLALLTVFGVAAALVSQRFFATRTASSYVDRSPRDVERPVPPKSATVPATGVEQQSTSLWSTSTSTPERSGTWPRTS